MLMPKRMKYRKQHRGRMKGKAYRGCELHFGEYGLKALEPSWVTSRQLEAARRAIVRHLRRDGRLWTRVFPDKPVTVRPAESRMGGGKGDVDHYVAVVKPGRVVFEISGVPEARAKRALWLGSQKLPIKCQIEERRDIVPAD
jgi:large subunit ribosomal protein L16